MYESGEKYAQVKHFTNENGPNQFSSQILIWEDNREWTFLLDDRNAAIILKILLVRLLPEE